MLKTGQVVLLMQKRRSILVLLLIILMLFASGLIIPSSWRGPNIAVLRDEPFLDIPVVSFSGNFSNLYYGEGGNLVHSFTKKEDIFSGNTFIKSELEESAGETTRFEVT